MHALVEQHQDQLVDTSLLSYGDRLEAGMEIVGEPKLNSLRHRFTHVGMPKG
jgi:hypothetical protein